MVYLRSLPALFCRRLFANALVLPNFLMVVLTVSGPSDVFGQSDDFNRGNDIGWTHYEPLAPFGAGVTYTFPNGGYRIDAAVSPQPGSLGPARGGSLRTDRSYSTFSATATLLSWDNSHDEAVGLLARITTPGLGTTNGYALSKAAGSFDLSRLAGERPMNIARTQVAWDPTHAYRFTFTGDGPHLSGTAYDLTDASVAPVTITADDATYGAGICGLAVFDNSNYPVEPAHSADVTFDNYYANVPEPGSAVLLGSTAIFMLSRRRSRPRPRTRRGEEEVSIPPALGPRGGRRLLYGGD